MKKFSRLRMRLGKLVLEYFGEIRKNAIVMAHFPPAPLSAPSPVITPIVTFLYTCLYHVIFSV